MPALAGFCINSINTGLGLPDCSKIRSMAARSYSTKLTLFKKMIVEFIKKILVQA